MRTPWLWRHRAPLFSFSLLSAPSDNDDAARRPRLRSGEIRRHACVRSQTFLFAADVMSARQSLPFLPARLICPSDLVSAGIHCGSFVEGREVRIAFFDDIVGGAGRRVEAMRVRWCGAGGCGGGSVGARETMQT